MVNWLSYGVVAISKYISPFIFSIAVLVWFLMLKKHVPIKKNFKLFTKITFFSIIGAAATPLIMIILSGNLISFLSSSFNVIGKINNWNSFSSVVNSVFKGFSITGGLLILSVVIVFIIEDAKKLIFAIFYPFPLFAAIARVNCFMEGCCFGKIHYGDFGVKYPPGSHASKFHYAKHGLISRFEVSYPVHPTQVYIIISMIFLFLLLFVLNRLKIKKNIIAGTMLIGYGLFNFIIEFFRQEQLLYDLLTLGQFMEIIIIFIGFFVIFKLKSCPAEENR